MSRQRRGACHFIFGVETSTTSFVYLSDIFFGYCAAYKCFAFVLFLNYTYSVFYRMTGNSPRANIFLNLPSGNSSLAFSCLPSVKFIKFRPAAHRLHRFDHVMK